MKLFNLGDMVKGWFVGDFEPTVLQTKDFEVAVKHYKRGDYEDYHVHKIATEITVIVYGWARMGENAVSAGDIIVIEPNEPTDFRAISNVITVCVKVPSVKGDKYDSSK